MRKITLFLAAFFCCTMMNAVNYSLTIAGTTVTDVNKTDVLGDGKVSFDPATNTLTLNNATIETTGNSAIIWSDFASTLTIMLKGTNNYIAMSGVPDYTGAIHTMGRLLITSEENPSSVAELKIVTSGTDGAPAIWSYTGDIIIENPISVNLQGAGNGAGTIYSQSGGKLIIDGATVNMMPCRIRTGGTVIARSAITSPSDAVVVADGRIMRSGTSSEYSKTTQVVISSNLRRLIYGATPKNVGNKVRVNDNPSTESQAYAWIELADYINLTATPAEGYAFTGWYDKNNQLLSTENPYSNHQLMTENTTLIYGQFEEQEQGDTRTIITHVEVNNWDPSFIKAGMDWWCGHIDDSLALVLQVPADAPYKFSYTYLYNVTENDTKVDGNEITPGIYRLKINLRIDGDEALSYRFPDWTEEIAMTGTVNGQECRVTSPTSYPTWSSCFIYTPEFVVEAQGIDEVSQESRVESRKVIRNGQLFIERNGKIYNALGAEVK